MRFIDLFAGVGGFRLGLEKANQKRELVHPRGDIEGQETPIHGGTSETEKGDDTPTISNRKVFRCVWSCEIDRWCQAVYKYRWGEVEAGDARLVDPDTIPDFDLLCAGFPCQSFSIAGKGKGFKDTRGTLFYEISRIAEAKRPRLLLLENVKGLLSNDRGQTFLAVLQELGRIGYRCEWQVLNSKNHGVPQNRERVFVVGHLGGLRGREVFPVTEGGGVPSEKPESKDICPTITSRYFKRGKTDPYIAEDFYQGRSARTYGENAPSLRKGRHGLKVIDTQGRKGKTPVPKEICPTLRSETHGNLPMIYRHPLNYGKKSIYSSDETHPSLRTVSRSPKIKPCLTPDRMKKRQHGRRFKEDGEPMFTLTGQDIHGIKIANAVDPDGYLRFGHRPRDKSGKPQLLPIGYRRIRRLTPRECERLQGFPDDWTRWGVDDKGDKVEISDTQRYRQMGNAVSVPVVEFLGRLLLGWRS